MSLPRKLGKACSVRCHGCQDPKMGDEEGKGTWRCCVFFSFGGEKEERGEDLLTLHLYNDPVGEREDRGRIITFRVLLISECAPYC